MAAIRKRGPYQYEVRVRRKGWPAQNKTFETKADAEAWAREIESEMDRRVFRSRREAERTTLRECLERYVREVTPSKKGAKQERTLIDRLCRHNISVRFMSAIRGADIAAFRDEKLSEGNSPFTVNNYLILLSHLFTVAIKEWGMESIGTNPVSLVRRPKLPRGRERRLLPSEETRLVDAAAPKLRAAIVLAIETGMRQSEIATLTHQDIDLDSRVAALLDTKNDERRVVPLSSRIVDELRRLPVNTDGRLVGLSSNVISQQFTQLCKQLEIRELRFHDLRHEATSRLFEKGFSLMEVATITGHKTLGMLQRYTHLRASDLAKRLG